MQPAFLKALSAGGRRTLLLVSGLSVLVLVGWLAAPSRSGPNLRPPVSFLERPIGARPALVPRSKALVERAIVPHVDSANLTTSDAWGIPVVRTQGRRTPVRRVDLFSWGYGRRGDVRFRIPSWARPSTGSDHHLAVVDGRRQLDLWVARRQRDGNWRAGARVETGGSPVVARVAATASGFSLTAGLVRPEEIRRGRIDHALAFMVPGVAKDHVPPALASDGRADRRTALPMGSHVQLDPSADISRLPRPTRIIARALQEYGAYLVDSGGSLAIRAESSLGRSRGRGKDIWAPVGVRSPYLSDIPWHRLRVLAPPG